MTVPVSCCASGDELKYGFADKYIWYLVVMERGGKGKSDESTFPPQSDKQKPCSLVNPMATHQAEKRLANSKGQDSQKSNVGFWY